MGERVNQAATTEDQARCPAAHAVTIDTDSGTAANMPGVSNWL